MSGGPPFTGGSTSGVLPSLDGHIDLPFAIYGAGAPPLFDIRCAPLKASRQESRTYRSSYSGLPASGTRAGSWDNRR